MRGLAEGAHTHALKLKSRTLCAVQASSQESKWVVGSNALHEENEVSMHQAGSRACICVCMLARA